MPTETAQKESGFHQHIQVCHKVGYLLQEKGAPKPAPLCPEGKGKFPRAYLKKLLFVHALNSNRSDTFLAESSNPFCKSGISPLQTVLPGAGTLVSQHNHHVYSSSSMSYEPYAYKSTYPFLKIS